MTIQEARRAIYAAARAIDTYVPHGSGIHEDALDVLDEALDEIRILEAAQGMAA